MASPQVHGQSKLLDPHRNAKYTLQVSDRIANAKTGDTAYSSVKFNHKPRQTAPDRETRITANDSSAEPFTLSLTDSTEDGSGTYTYSGSRTSSKKTYVLLFDSAKQTCTLEPLDAAYTFNIASTPFEPDAAKLAKTYRHIKPRKQSVAAAAAGTASDADDGLFSDASEAHSALGDGSPANYPESDSDAPADESNPFDYRHFLNTIGQDTDGGVSPNPASTMATPQSVTRPTPLSQVRNAQDLPTPKPQPKQTTQRRRKSPDPTTRKPAAKAATTKPKPAKDTTTPSTTKPKPTTKPAAAPPEIRLDRRASTRVTSPPPTTKPAKPSAPPSQPSPAPTSTHDSDASGDSDNDLGFEVDYGTSGAPAAPRRSMALAFGATASDGPISLRSAADSASPNSTLATPVHNTSRRRPGNEGRDEIDFDEQQSEEDDGYAEDDEGVPGEVEEAGNQNLAEESGDEENADADADADGDVEPMALGSPAAAQTVEDGGAGAGQEGDDMDDLDDFFEAEINQALASAAEEDMGDAAPPEEESEVESEEE